MTPSFVQKFSFGLALSLGLACFTTPAHAAQYNAGGINVTVDTSWVTGAVRDEAMKMTKTLIRPVLVYHYVPRQYVKMGSQKFPVKGPVNADDASLRNLVLENMTSRMARFWDVNIPVSGRSYDGGAMAPNGLYVANEPVISYSYGGSDTGWLMYQIEFPQGMRYLDGRYRRPPLGPNLIAALNQRGCAAMPDWTARTLIKADTSQKECRQALNDLVAALDAMAIAYIFKEEPLKQDCYEWSAAFVMIRPDAMASMEFMVKDMPTQNDGLDDLRGILNGIFQRAGRGLLFPSVPVAPEQDVTKFMSDNYYTCNKAKREW